MPVKNGAARYGAVAMVLHWLIALSIFLNVALAFWFNDLLDHHDPLRGAIIPVHESIGISVLVLSLIRLAWRLMNRPPEPPADMNPVVIRLAHATHYALYFLMIMVPFLGWGLASTGPRPFLYFGTVVWPKIWFLATMQMPDKRAYGHVVGTAHEWLGYILFFLAIGHMAAAVFWHYAIQRDKVLQRMLPGTQTADNERISS